MKSGTPFVVVAAFAVGLVVGILLDGSPAADPAPTGGAGGDRRVEVLPPELPTPRAPAETPGSRAASPPTPAEAPVAEDTRPASFRVWVVNADGTPARAGVYALRAGAPGADYDEVPHAYHEPPGPARLEVPGPGPWDVGACGREPFVAAIVTDRAAGVDAPAEVTVNLPPAAPIRIETVGPWPDTKAAGVRVELNLRSEHWLDVPFPGRDERKSFSIAWPDIPSSGRLEIAGVPLDLRYRLTVRVVAANPRDEMPEPPFAVLAEPRDIRAGDTVRLRVAPPAYLALAVRVADLEDWPEGRMFHLKLELTQEASRQVVYESYGGRGGLANAEDPVRLSGVAGPATLDWSGSGVRPGRLEDVVLKARETVTREIHLEPETVAPKTPLPVTIVGFPAAPEGEEAEAVDLVGLGDEESAVRLDESLEKPVASLPGSWRLARFLLARQGDRLASRPVPVPTSGGVSVPLEPAGLLLVIVDLGDADPWGEHGEVRVSRKDGLPLNATEELGFHGRTAWSAVVETGHVIGPLPAGTYEFRATLGRTRLPDVKARVRAGRIDVLRIER